MQLTDHDRQVLIKVLRAQQRFSSFLFVLMQDLMEEDMFQHPAYLHVLRHQQHLDAAVDAFTTLLSGEYDHADSTPLGPMDRH